MKIYFLITFKQNREPTFTILLKISFAKISNLSHIRKANLYHCFRILCADFFLIIPYTSPAQHIYVMHVTYMG